MPPLVPRAETAYLLRGFDIVDDQLDSPPLSPQSGDGLATLEQLEKPNSISTESNDAACLLLGLDGHECISTFLDRR
jgi:hypothetical protein